MNLNPFVFQHKVYPKCPLSTMLNGFLAGMQRIFVLFAAIILLVLAIEDIDNWPEAMTAAIIMLILYVVLRKYKCQWTDKLAEKESLKNS